MTLGFARGDNAARRNGWVLGFRTTFVTSRVRQYFVYILSSRSRQLYVGITNNLHLRLAQHREGKHGYTSRYRIHRLVYWEMTTQAMVAIEREKQIKAFRREKKVGLIQSMNPAWNDLAGELGLTADPSLRSG
jgi:putative endonuclease